MSPYFGTVSFGCFIENRAFAYLIKFAIITADKFAEILIEFLEYSLPRFIPKSRVFTVFLFSVLEGKIQVRDVRFPVDIVLPLCEWSGCVFEPIEVDQIGHPVLVSANLKLLRFAASPSDVGNSR